MNTAATRGGEEVQSTEGGGTGPQGPIPIQKKIKKENPKEKTVWVEVPSTPMASSARAMY